MDVVGHVQDNKLLEKLINFFGFSHSLGSFSSASINKFLLTEDLTEDEIMVFAKNGSLFLTLSLINKDRIKSIDKISELLTLTITRSNNENLNDLMRLLIRKNIMNDEIFSIIYEHVRALPLFNKLVKHFKMKGLNSKDYPMANILMMTSNVNRIRELRELGYYYMLKTVRDFSLCEIILNSNLFDKYSIINSFMRKENKTKIDFEKIMAVTGNDYRHDSVIDNGTYGTTGSIFDFDNDDTLIVTFDLVYSLVETVREAASNKDKAVDRLMDVVKEMYFNTTFGNTNPGAFSLFSVARILQENLQLGKIRYNMFYKDRTLTINLDPGMYPISDEKIEILNSVKGVSAKCKIDDHFNIFIKFKK